MAVRDRRKQHGQNAVIYPQLDESQDDEPPFYRAATYENVTTASLQQISDSPQSVVRNLVGKLLRSLGNGSNWPWLFN